jgi:hypothetical protein
MCGYPIFRVPTEAPGPTSGEATNPQVGPIFGAPLGYRIFLLSSRQRILGGAEAGGPGAPTINAKKH